MLQEPFPNGRQRTSSYFSHSSICSTLILSLFSFSTEINLHRWIFCTNRSLGCVENWPSKCIFYLMLTDETTLMKCNLTILDRLNTRLTDLEKHYCIQHQWTVTDQEYIEVQHHFPCEKQFQLAEAMWACSACRQFLLTLKSKYASMMPFIIRYYMYIDRNYQSYTEGRKIAKMLSNQISRETRTLKALLQE